jgi:hypothetical protein
MLGHVKADLMLMVQLPTICMWVPPVLQHLPLGIGILLSMHVFGLGQKTLSGVDSAIVVLFAGSLEEVFSMCNCGGVTSVITLHCVTRWYKAHHLTPLCSNSSLCAHPMSDAWAQGVVKAW